MRHTERSEKLIAAVRDRPFLYDQSLQNFKHIGMKNRCWMEVAKTVYGRTDKATVNRVKIRWKSLRDAFVKQQRKRQDCTAKVRPYIYESEMQFLLPHILLKDRDTDGYESGNESISVPVSNFEVKTEDCPSLNASLSGDSHLDETIDPDAPPLIKELIWDDKQHPIDAFFYGIAQTVKQFKPITAARVKKAVANIVIDAEIEDIATN